MAFQSYESLEVWQMSLDVAEKVYHLLTSSREFALKDQLQRASISVPSNIAEGAERGGQDFRRFLRIARGSNAELRTQLILAIRINAISEEQFEELNADLTRISKMLTKLDQSVERKLNTGTLTTEP